MNHCRRARNFNTKVMIDHQIIMHILYSNCFERAAYLNECKPECIGDKSFIFFPLTHRYYDRLTSLDAHQYMQRLKMLCHMLERCN